MPSVTLFRGDCLKLLERERFAGVSAVVADPPYGIAIKTNNSRFSGGKRAVPRRTDFRSVIGDDRPFDPSPWLSFPRLVLWGANFYSNRLPGGGWLVWQKKPPANLGKFCGDCEVAWFKGSRAIYLYSHTWDGFNRDSERGKTLHPTQKPVAVMRWCIERLRLAPDSTILDPYMGSGSTGVAAVELGFNFIGCEIDPAYFAIAKKRITESRIKNHEQKRGDARE